MLLYPATEEEVLETLRDATDSWNEHHDSYREPFKSDLQSFLASKVRQLFIREGEE